MGVDTVANAKQATVTIGEIVAVYGIKGWVKIKSWTQPAQTGICL